VREDCHDALAQSGYTRRGPVGQDFFKIGSFGGKAFRNRIEEARQFGKVDLEIVGSATIPIPAARCASACSPAPAGGCGCSFSAIPMAMSAADRMASAMIQAAVAPRRTAGDGVRGSDCAQFDRIRTNPSVTPLRGIIRIFLKP
jgi:hypothetical protein